MRLLLPILFSLIACWSAPGEDKPSSPAPLEAPRTLEEAHHQLESLLSKEELSRIDAMKSEKEMIEYHLSVGMAIRNNWGLWGGSPLAVHLWQLGFTHPDDMSNVILQTFWCRRHKRDLRLEERADYYQAYWKAAADPPATAMDPADGSAVEWSMSFGAGTDEKPRQIHVGKSEKTGRWLAYEYNKGVYVPDAELLKKIATFQLDPFAHKK